MTVIQPVGGEGNIGGGDDDDDDDVDDDDEDDDDNLKVLCLGEVEDCEGANGEEKMCYHYKQ